MLAPPVAYVPLLIALVCGRHALPGPSHHFATTSFCALFSVVSCVSCTLRVMIVRSMLVSAVEALVTDKQVGAEQDRLVVFSLRSFLARFPKYHTNVGCPSSFFSTLSIYLNLLALQMLSTIFIFNPAVL